MNCQSVRKSAAQLKAESKQIVVNGVLYPTVHAACLEHGLGYSTVYMRLEAGWTPDQAFGFADRITQTSKRRLVTRATRKAITRPKMAMA
jgi:hypothetical protein